MRPIIFFVGIGMVILGPLVTLSAFSSCLRTILSGNVFACVTDIVYFVLGGVIFVAGVITAIIGVFIPDPVPAASSGSFGGVSAHAIGGAGGMQEMWARLRFRPLLLPIVWAKAGLKQATNGTSTEASSNPFSSRISIRPRAGGRPPRRVV